MTAIERLYLTGQWMVFLYTYLLCDKQETSNEKLAEATSKNVKLSDLLTNAETENKALGKQASILSVNVCIVIVHLCSYITISL
jgi:hypothetical protein